MRLVMSIIAIDPDKQILLLKAPITTAADNKFCDIFPNFPKKEGMIFHENCLLADYIFS